MVVCCAHMYTNIDICENIFSVWIVSFRVFELGWVDLKWWKQSRWTEEVWIEITGRVLFSILFNQNWITTQNPLISLF